MKKLIILSLAAASFTAQAQLKVKTNGDIDLRYSHWTNGLDIEIESPGNGNYNMVTLLPSTNWYGSLGTAANKFGYAYISHLYYDVQTDYSDSRIKENIEPVSSVLGKLNTINTYTYQYKDDFLKIEDAKENLKSTVKRTKFGFMAQDIQELFPELVFESDTGLLSLNYVGMIPLLVKGIQEQQVQISSLQYQLQKYQELEGQRVAETDAIKASYLTQNFPNPFTEATVVKYSVAEQATTASIMIFDMTGTLLRTYDDIEKGDVELTIDAETLDAGMFIYSLIVDGVELDSKRMILTK